LISFASSLVSILLATFVPIYVGLYLFSGLRISPRYLASFGLGILFWYFLDVMNDSVLLDVNSGFSGGLEQLALVSLFLLGLLILVLLDTSGTHGADLESYERALLTVPLLFALGIGFHAVAEGLAFGALASATPSGSVIEALGGYSPGVSYVLHKLLEGVVIGVAYRLYVRTESSTRGDAFHPRVFIGLVAGIPTLIGDAVGYYFALSNTYLFSLAGGCTWA